MKSGMNEGHKSGMKDAAASIVQTLRGAGFQAYLVGGCVRDLLLGKEPKDFDVSTDATPEQVMKIFPETYAVGAQFGVVLVPVAKEDSEMARPGSVFSRDSPSRLRPSAATSAIPTVAIRTKCASAGIRGKM